MIWNSNPDEAPLDGTTILFVTRQFRTISMGYYQDGHIWTGHIVKSPSAIPRSWADVATHWMRAPELPGREMPSEKPPLIEISDRTGKNPCGECHISEDETCDICGATHAAV